MTLNKGSKIYPQNQVILDCIMPTIPLKHKCLSIIPIWAIVSHTSKVLVFSKRSKKKKKKKKKFTFLNWGKTDMVLGEKGDYFRLGMGQKFVP